MDKNTLMFGVSPAYFISRFSDRFSAIDIAGSLPDLARAGFDAFQPEIFHPETIDSWLAGGAARVDQAARDCGLSPSQFVGHFLLHAFESPEAIVSAWGVEETEKTLAVMAGIGGCTILTVPIPGLPLTDPRHLTPAGNAALRASLQSRPDEKSLARRTTNMATSMSAIAIPSPST